MSTHNVTVCDVCGIQERTEAMNIHSKWIRALVQQKISRAEVFTLEVCPSCAGDRLGRVSEGLASWLKPPPPPLVSTPPPLGSTDEAIEKQKKREMHERYTAFKREAASRRASSRKKSR